MIRLGNNKVLKTLLKTLTFVDTDADANAKANADADAGGSTIALRELRSGELIIIINIINVYIFLMLP